MADNHIAKKTPREAATLLVDQDFTPEFIGHYLAPLFDVEGIECFCVNARTQTPLALTAQLLVRKIRDTSSTDIRVFTRNRRIAAQLAKYAYAYAKSDSALTLKHASVETLHFEFPPIPPSTTPDIRKIRILPQSARDGVSAAQLYFVY